MQHIITTTEFRLKKIMDLSYQLVNLNCQTSRRLISQNYPSINNYTIWLILLYQDSYLFLFSYVTNNLFLLTAFLLFYVVPNS